MKNISALIKQEILDFIDFLSDKNYLLRLEDGHSEITYEILQKYINEYLERV